MFNILNRILHFCLLTMAHENDSDLQEDLIGHDPEDLAFLQPRPGDVVQNTPKPPQRLEAFSVICIICNRMIGM